METLPTYIPEEYAVQVEGMCARYVTAKKDFLTVTYGDEQITQAYIRYEQQAEEVEVVTNPDLAFAVLDCLSQHDDSGIRFDVIGFAGHFALKNVLTFSQAMRVIYTLTHDSSEFVAHHAIEQLADWKNSSAHIDYLRCQGTNDLLEFCLRSQIMRLAPSILQSQPPPPPVPKTRGGLRLVE
jgi:hypothetical protein